MCLLPSVVIHMLTEINKCTKFHKQVIFVLSWYISVPTFIVRGPGINKLYTQTLLKSLHLDTNDKLHVYTKFILSIGIKLVIAPYLSIIIYHNVGQVVLFVFYYL